jgi:hypothetical protein
MEKYAVHQPCRRPGCWAEHAGACVATAQFLQDECSSVVRGRGRLRETRKAADARKMFRVWLGVELDVVVLAGGGFAARCTAVNGRHVTGGVTHREGIMSPHVVAGFRSYKPEPPRLNRQSSALIISLKAYRTHHPRSTTRRWEPKTWVTVGTSATVLDDRSASKLHGYVASAGRRRGLAISSPEHRWSKHATRHPPLNADVKPHRQPAGPAGQGDWHTKPRSVDDPALTHRLVADRLPAQHFGPTSTSSVAPLVLPAHTRWSTRPEPHHCRLTSTPRPPAWLRACHRACPMRRRRVWLLPRTAPTRLLPRCVASLRGSQVVTEPGTTAMPGNWVGDE